MIGGLILEIEEWLNGKLNVYALREVEENKYEGTESPITAQRRGNWFIVNFNDGYDLWYFNELTEEGSLIDVVGKESIDDLKYLLSPFLEYMGGGKFSLPDDYFDNPEYLEEPTEEDWERWHELQRGEENE